MPSGVKRGFNQFRGRPVTASEDLSDLLIGNEIRQTISAEQEPGVGRKWLCDDARCERASLR